MTSKEKIAFVKREIMEQAEINPSGSFCFELIEVVDLEATGGFPDEAPVLLSKREQWSIIKKLEEECFVKNVQLDENRQNVWLEMCSEEDIELNNKIDEFLYGTNNTNNPKTENYNENKKNTEQTKKQKIQLHNFPEDLKWEEISIQFLNGQEVIIKIRNDRYQTTYDMMGFQDKRKRQPNKQWEFLLGLSQTDGKLSWKDSRATLKGKKQKQLLAGLLKAYFGIQEDPFYTYRKEKSYKIKILLIPESYKNEDDLDDLGIKESYNEEATQVDDKYNW